MCIRSYLIPSISLSLRAAPFKQLGLQVGPIYSGDTQISPHVASVTRYHHSQAPALFSADPPRNRSGKRLYSVANEGYALCALRASSILLRPVLCPAENGRRQWTGHRYPLDRSSLSRNYAAHDGRGIH